MPTTTAKRPVPDMTPAWAGRDKATAKRKFDRAIAELLAQGNTVTVIGPDGATTTYRP